MFNKKGVAEALSWTAGLIVIFSLVVVAILAYNIGGLGKRANIDVTMSSIDYDFYDSLRSQRIGAAFFMYDFASSEKGEILRKISESFRGEAAFGKSVDVFIKMISYDYFGLVMDEMRVIVRERSDLKGVTSCSKWDDFALFRLPNKDKYSNVGVLVRECKHV